MGEFVVFDVVPCGGEQAVYEGSLARVETQGVSAQRGGAVCYGGGENGSVYSRIRAEFFGGRGVFMENLEEPGA